MDEKSVGQMNSGLPNSGLPAGQCSIGKNGIHIYQEECSSTGNGRRQSRGRAARITKLPSGGRRLQFYPTPLHTKAHHSTGLHSRLQLDGHPLDAFVLVLNLSDQLLHLPLLVVEVALQHAPPPVGRVPLLRQDLEL